MSDDFTGVCPVCRTEQSYAKSQRLTRGSEESFLMYDVLTAACIPCGAFTQVSAYKGIKDVAQQSS